MNNKVMYMTFYENWVEVMEMCTPEEWYELCKIITNLRFKGIDTDAKTISNMKIRMAWNLIRPSILKSNRDKRYNDTKRNSVNPEETKKSTITDVKTTEFDIPNCQISNTSDLSPSNSEEVEQPQSTDNNTTEAIKTTIEDFITDEEKYGETVMDFIDKYEDKVIPALNAITEYYHLKNEDYKTLALGANDVINDCVKEYGLKGNDIKKLEFFTWDYQKEMVKDRKNKQFKAA